MNDAQSIKERQTRAIAIKGSDQVDYMASVLYGHVLNCIMYKAEVAPKETEMEFSFSSIKEVLGPLVDRQVRAKCGLGDARLMEGCAWDGLLKLVMESLVQKLTDGGFTPLTSDWMLHVDWSKA